MFLLSLLMQLARLSSVPNFFVVCPDGICVKALPTASLRAVLKLVAPHSFNSFIQSFSEGGVKISCAPFF